MPAKRITNEQRAKRRKRVRRTIVGLVIVALMCVGIYYLASLGVGSVTKLLDDTEEKTVFANTIAPLVSLDPAPFSSLEKADEDVLLEAAVWGALSVGDTESYARNEESAILLPSIEVDRTMAKMYGQDFFISHHTFTDLDLTFEYDESTAMYTIPVTSMAGSYTPVVEKITKTSNTKVLTVAYMQSATTFSGETDTVVKYMEYVMLRSGRNYYIYAVRIPEQDTANLTA